MKLVSIFCGNQHESAQLGLSRPDGTFAEVKGLLEALSLTLSKPFAFGTKANDVQWLSRRATSSEQPLEQLAVREDEDDVGHGGCRHTF